MIRKRQLLLISIIIIIIFFTSTNYLLTKLTSSQTEVKSVHEEIYLCLKDLPALYKVHKPFADDVFQKFLEHLIGTPVEQDVNTSWDTANSWVSKKQLVDVGSPFIGSVLNALKKSKIIKADLDDRGTQLKLLLTLEGHQNVVFKPKWYSIDKVIEGPVYAGKDRHSSEIVAFYLSVVLNIPFTPCSVERIVSLSNELMPVATKRLINTTFEIGDRTCVYGKCFYCKREDPLCEDENLRVYGTVIFNINATLKNYRSPWQRTYKKNKKAIWEVEDNYCQYVKEKLTKRRLLDLIDVSIFDFLIQNGDRHHYETLHDNIILLDNGKGFGNSNVFHLDILAPLYQCCLLRKTTIQKLQNVAGGSLSKKLKAIPNFENFLTPAHVSGIEERLLLVFATIEYCKSKNKKT